MIHHKMGTISRLLILVAACMLLTLLPSPVVAQRARPAKRPNVILIMADDLGYGDLGSYGQKLFRTPNLDRMANEGLRFTEFYAASPVCAPSRASLMTGMHQGHARIRGNMGRNNERVPLRPEDRTIAEVLRGAGYTTGIVGKWGLGEPGTTGTPGRQGFDYFFGYLNQNHAHNYYPDYLWRNDERVSPPRGAYSHDLFTEEALDFIRRENARPFFLYIAYTIPHANNELTRKTGNGMEVPSDEPYSKESWPQQAKNYAAMIWRMDSDVGKIFALLKELKLDEDTLVIFSSDNGPQGKDEGGYDQSLFNSNGSFRGLKRDLYEGGVRVPMIVRWPGHVRARQQSSHYWAGWDLLPTLAGVAGAKPPAGIDGVSALPVLLGRRAPERGPLYWEFHEGGFAQAVRLGSWKAVRHGLSGPIELYDLRADIKETRDVSGLHPDIVRRAIEIMKREHVESEDWPAR